MLNFAYTAYGASIKRAKKDINRESAYMDRNFERTKERLFLSLADYYEPTDKILFKEKLMKAVHLPQDQKIPPLAEIGQTEEQIDRFIEDAYAHSGLNRKQMIEQLFSRKQKEIEQMDDPFIRLAIKLYPVYR